MGGRLVTSFSYQQGSAMDHIMRRMRDSNKNISEVITNILENHYELYDQVEHLKGELQRVAKLLGAHTGAAEMAGLVLTARHDDFGRKSAPITHHVYKHNGQRLIFQLPPTDGEEE